MVDISEVPFTGSHVAVLRLAMEAMGLW